MKRLTKDDVKQMGMYELSLNQVFVENNEAWYRNFEMEMTARSFMRSICARNGINCSIDDNEFDEDMFYWLEDGYETLNGLIAILYRALWSFAEVRERLKTYEDTGLEPEEILALLKSNVVMVQNGNNNTHINRVGTLNL